MLVVAGVVAVVAQVVPVVAGRAVRPAVQEFLKQDLRLPQLPDQDRRNRGLIRKPRRIRAGFPAQFQKIGDLRAVAAQPAVAVEREHVAALRLQNQAEQPLLFFGLKPGDAAGKDRKLRRNRLDLPVCGFQQLHILLAGEIRETGMIRLVPDFDGTDFAAVMSRESAHEPRPVVIFGPVAAAFASRPGIRRPGPERREIQDRRPLQPVLRQQLPDRVVDLKPPLSRLRLNPSPARVVADQRGPAPRRRHRLAALFLRRFAAQVRADAEYESLPLPRDRSGRSQIRIAETAHIRCGSGALLQAEVQIVYAELPGRRQRNLRRFPGFQHLRPLSLPGRLSGNIGDAPRQLRGLRSGAAVLQPERQPLFLARRQHADRGTFAGIERQQRRRAGHGELHLFQTDPTRSGVRAEISREPGETCRKIDLLIRLFAAVPAPGIRFQRVDPVTELTPPRRLRRNRLRKLEHLAVPVPQPDIQSTRRPLRRQVRRHADFGGVELRQFPKLFQYKFKMVRTAIVPLEPQSPLSVRQCPIHSGLAVFRRTVNFQCGSFGAEIHQSRRSRSRDTESRG